MKSLVILPYVTEKSMALAGDGKYEFIVSPFANKQSVAAAVAKQFGVEPVKVAIINKAGNSINFRRTAGTTARTKKAIVTLKKGESIAEFSMPSESETTKTPEVGATAKESKSQEIKTESKIVVRSKKDKNSAAKNRGDK